MTTRVSFFDRTKWSDNKYAWAYAIFILLLTVVFAAILKFLNIYEGMALRIIHIVFILIGFVLLMWDHNRHREPITYLKAFLLLLRTGVYFCLILLPVLLVYFELNAEALEMFREKEAYNSDLPLIQILFFSYFETITTVLLAAMTVAYLANSKRKV